MLSALEKVKDALLTVSDSVYHYTASGAKDKYIVWAEDGQASALRADNITPANVIEGTIDYFTSDEDDETVKEIPEALNGARIAWDLNSVQYEDETDLIHHEWIFRARQGYGEEQNGEDQI